MPTRNASRQLLIRLLGRGVNRCQWNLFSTEKFASKEFEEVRVKVPWGFIAGKWYGPKHVRPLVGFHGWQDNAGTFDTLAPLLPSNIGFISVDMPGHGLSSYLPDGISYHSIDYVLLIRRLMDELNWEKISIIAHSMGSFNSFVFSALFPDKVDMLVSLDIIKPPYRPPERIIDHLSSRLEGFVKADRRVQSKSEPPCYSYDEMVERLYLGASKSVSKECCHYLLKRNIKPSVHEPHKFYFSRDSRLKYSLFYAFHPAVSVEMAKRIKCPHLFIKALQSPFFEDKKYYDQVMDVLKNKSNFEFHEVEGTHHVHLNEPMKISKILNPFINKHRLY